MDGYLLKPMNCPHHIRIYADGKHSHRDLPIRLAEFGTVYRWEQSGELGGMTRVRGFTQDDAHLFVTLDQLGSEVRGCIDLVKAVFTTLGMTDYRVRVGLRDPDSSKFVGDPADWDLAEKACREAAESLGVPFSEEPGEAAFMAPRSTSSSATSSAASGSWAPCRSTTSCRSASSLHTQDPTTPSTSR